MQELFEILFDTDPADNGLYLNSRPMLGRYSDDPALKPNSRSIAFEELHLSDLSIEECLINTIKKNKKSVSLFRAGAGSGKSTILLNLQKALYKIPAPEMCILLVDSQDLEEFSVDNPEAALDAHTKFPGLLRVFAARLLDEITVCFKKNHEDWGSWLAKTLSNPNGLPQKFNQRHDQIIQAIRAGIVGATPAQIPDRVSNLIKSSNTEPRSSFAFLVDLQNRAHAPHQPLSKLKKSVVAIDNLDRIHYEYLSALSVYFNRTISTKYRDRGKVHSLLFMRLSTPSDRIRSTSNIKRLSLRTSEPCDIVKHRIIRFFLDSPGAYIEEWQDLSKQEQDEFQSRLATLFIQLTSPSFSLSRYIKSLCGTNIRNAFRYLAEYAADSNGNGLKIFPDFKPLKKQQILNICHYARQLIRSDLGARLVLSINEFAEKDDEQSEVKEIAARIISTIDRQHYPAPNSRAKQNSQLGENLNEAISILLNQESSFSARASEIETLLQTEKCQLIAREMNSIVPSDQMRIGLAEALARLSLCLAPFYDQWPATSDIRRNLRQIFYIVIQTISKRMSPDQLAERNFLVFVVYYFYEDRSQDGLSLLRKQALSNESALRIRFLKGVQSKKLNENTALVEDVINRSRSGYSADRTQFSRHFPSYGFMSTVHPEIQDIGLRKQTYLFSQDEHSANPINAFALNFLYQHLRLAQERKIPSSIVTFQRMSAFLEALGYTTEEIRASLGQLMDLDFRLIYACADDSFLNPGNEIQFWQSQLPLNLSLAGRNMMRLMTKEASFFQWQLFKIPPLCDNKNFSNDLTQGTLPLLDTFEHILDCAQKLKREWIRAVNNLDGQAVRSFQPTREYEHVFLGPMKFAVDSLESILGIISNSQFRRSYSIKQMIESSPRVKKLSNEISMFKNEVERIDLELGYLK